MAATRAHAPYSRFAVGAALFIYDFFRHAPRFEVRDVRDTAPDDTIASGYRGEAASASRA